MDYELLIIISPAVEKDSEIEEIKNQIKQLGGEIKQEDDWGRRTLSYPIQHQIAGNYYLFRLKLSPRKAGELKSELNLREGLLRFLITKAGGDKS